MNSRRPWLTLPLVALAVVALAAQSVHLDDAAIRVEVEKIRQPGMMNVPRADGEFLHDLIVVRGYRRGLEIGTSNGYSAVWIALALARRAAGWSRSRSTRAAPTWPRRTSSAWAWSPTWICAAATR